MADEPMASRIPRASFAPDLADDLFEAMLAVMPSGVVAWANRAALDLFCAPEGLSGRDVRDLLRSRDCSVVDASALAGLDAFSGLDSVVADPSRPHVRQRPQKLALLAETLDGSFIPVLVRGLPRSAGDAEGASLLSAERDCAAESSQELARLTDEARRIRARLLGTLDIVSCASLGEGSLVDLVPRVANELQRVLEADAAVVYLADDYGFTPYGASEGFKALDVQESYLPMGVGVPTLVKRNGRTTRFQLVTSSQSPDQASVMLDLDTDKRFKVRSLLAQRCSSIVGTPVYSYDKMVAVVVVGWFAPYSVAPDEVMLLDTVARFLSVEFAAAVSVMEQKRSSTFALATNEIRDLVRSEGEMSASLVARIIGVVARVVPSRILLLESNLFTNTTVVRLRDESTGEFETLDFPRGIQDVFPNGTSFTYISPDSSCGMWIGRHTNLETGYGVLLTSGELSDEPVQTALLVMRAAQDHPFDESERVFLMNLAQDAGKVLHAEQERVHDAEISNALQAGLRNVLPEAPGVTTASLYISATESAVVGGDFFDLYDLSDGRIVVVMGDVSGKGVEAAAMASLVKTALAAYAWNYLDPASMVSSLNKLFLNFSRLETFSSLVVVSIDFGAMRATYCSAGHPPAMVVHHPNNPAAELELLTVQSPVVGAFDDLEYANGTFEFGLGDLMYLYTDGTTEARNAAGSFFGEEALRDTLLAACRLGVEKVPEAVLSAIEAFSGGDLHDDIAMVALRFDGLDAGPDPARSTEPLEGVPANEAPVGVLGDDAFFNDFLGLPAETASRGDGQLGGADA